MANESMITWRLWVSVALLGLVGAGSGADPLTCVIPKGYFEGQVQGTSIPLPWYGERCAVSQSYYQVFVQQCVPKYCCSQPCTCDGGNDFYDSHCGTNATVISCYELVTRSNTTVYQCCTGTLEIDHTCIKTLDCAVRNGGCSDMCVTNASTGVSSCACSSPTRVPLDPYNCADIPNSSTLLPVSPMVFVDITPSFSLHWLIAIIFAGILLLLLILLILLILLCVRRRKRRQAAAAEAELKTAEFVNSAYDKKEPPAHCVIKANESKIKLSDDDLCPKGKIGWNKDEKVKVVDELKSFNDKGGEGKRAENDYAKISAGKIDAVRSGRNGGAGDAGATIEVKKPGCENLYVAGPGIGGKQTESLNSSEVIYEYIPGPQESGRTGAQRGGGVEGEGRSSADYESV